MLISIRVAPEFIKKVGGGGGINLQYNEQLRILMMTRKINVAMKELNDNIDRKCVVII